MKRTTAVQRGGVTMPTTRGATLTDKHVGAQIRMRRIMLGVSQTDLARAVGVTFQQVQKYENGKNRVSASRMQQLAKCLDVPMTFFFEGAPEIQVIDGRKSNAKCAITPGYVTHFLTSPEGQDIMKAFSRISNRQMRRELVDLAQQLASNSGRSR